MRAAVECALEHLFWPDVFLDRHNLDPDRHSFLALAAANLLGEIDFLNDPPLERYFSDQLTHGVRCPFPASYASRRRARIADVGLSRFRHRAEPHQRAIGI